MDVWSILGFSTSLRTGGFEKATHKSCDQVDGKAHYEIIGTAMKECLKNDECLGIYEDICNGRKGFDLCKKTRNISNGLKLASCVYTKVPGEGIKKRGVSNI